MVSNMEGSLFIDDRIITQHHCHSAIITHPHHHCHTNLLVAADHTGSRRERDTKIFKSDSNCKRGLVEIIRSPKENAVFTSPSDGLLYSATKHINNPFPQ